MRLSIQGKILEAISAVLKQFARVLLTFGIDYRDFAEIAKSAFVHVASEDYGLRGRPTNISRVAVMTGLTRKEVRRLRKKASEKEELANTRRTPMNDVLYRWHNDADFCMESGRPRRLSFDEGSNSFTDLARKVIGDVPPGAVRTELIRVGAIAADEKGRLCAIKDSQSSSQELNELAEGFENILHPAAITLAHNFGYPGSNDVWPTGVAVAMKVSDSDVDRLRQICSKRSAKFVGTFEDLFAAHEVFTEDAPNDDAQRAVGISVLYFEDASMDVQSSTDAT